MRKLMKGMALSGMLFVTAMAWAQGADASKQAPAKPQEAAKQPAPPPPPELKLKIGDVAPDFTLLDNNLNPVSLHDFRGKKNVLIGFYVFAFTGG